MLTLFFGVYHYSDASFKISRPSALNNGLVGHWTFDGADTNFTTNTVTDRSGNGNHGTMINMSTTTARAPGKIGQALKFDGVDDYINLSGVNLSTVNYTLVAWIKPTRISNEWVVVTQDSSSGIWVKNSGINFFNSGDCIKGTLATNSWSHVIGVSDGSGRKIYINGVLAGSCGTTATAIINKIGSATGSYSFNGLIDEVRVYNRALSASEVKQLYNQGASKLNIPFNEGLIGYWNFDLGRGGNVVYDMSGYRNNGSIKGTVAWVDGREGAALNFDGSSYVELGNSETIGSDDSFTLSAWINTNNVGSGNNASIYGEFNTTSSETKNFLGIIGDVEKINLDQYSPSGGPTEGNTTIPTNEWHYVSYAQNGVNWWTYLDGRLDNSGADAETYSGNTPNKSWIGARAVASGIYSGSGFLGKIDELRLYNRSLSAGEIYRLYKLTRTKVNVSTNTLTSGLVGHWTFDGADTNFTTNTVADKSGQGNNGTMINMSTSTARAPGKIGQALKFDGVDDYVNLVDGSLALGTSNFTISVYLKHSQASTWRGIFVKGASGGSGYGLHLNTSGLVDLGIESSVNTHVTSTTRVDDNKWHHVLISATRNGNALFYIDGILDATRDISSQNGSLNNSIVARIGMYSSGNTWPFNGLIDEVRVYNRALSASEVKVLYNMGR